MRYAPAPESDLNLELMRQIDRIHLEQPVYGSPLMTAQLCNLKAKGGEKLRDRSRNFSSGNGKNPA